MRPRQRKILISAMALALVATAVPAQASAQATILAATWSADSGPSLFQSLGITVPTHEVRSQILSSYVGDFKVVQISNLHLPTARNLSVPPLSTDSVPAVGLSSAPPPSAAFVPQIAQHGGGAEPVLVAQVKAANAMPKTMPKTISKTEMPPVPTMMTASAYWGDILSRYLHPGADGLTRFDYAALKASTGDTAHLDKYIDDLAAQKPSAMPRDEAIAYWANLYNALTVQVVAENYPVKSIRKIKSGYRAGPWKREVVTIEGRTLSLDNIEHDIMRPTYQTPLVHYMVNCASIGCPNLKTTPWNSANLSADQEAAARAYINSPRGAKLSNGNLQVSSIYKWFKADFGGNAAGVLAHLSQYADADLRSQLEGRKKIDKYAYDWDVNAPK